MIYYMDSSCLVKRLRYPAHNQKHSYPLSWSSSRLIMMGVSLDF